MLYVLMGLFAAGIVVADQLSKWWVVHNIASCHCYADGDLSVCAGHIEKLKEAFGVTEQQLVGLPTSVDGIDGVFELQHVHNTGAAFSSFSGMQWLFALVFAVFTLGIIWELAKKKMGFTAFERWCIVAIWAGGLGNMIDRVRLGFVVDMIEVEFIRFPVFNVADCFISVGCVLLLIHLVFFNKAFWKDDKNASES